MSAYMITAIEMAKNAGVDSKAFRQALRKEQLPWHQHNSRWAVPKDGPEHADMQRVLRSLLAK